MNNFHSTGCYPTNHNCYNSNCCNTGNFNDFKQKKESLICSLFTVEQFLCNLQTTCNIVNIYKFLH